MQVIFKVERKSHRSKFYQVIKCHRDENGHDRTVEIVSRPISYEEACWFRNLCEQQETS